MLSACALDAQSAQHEVAGLGVEGPQQRLQALSCGTAETLSASSGGLLFSLKVGALGSEGLVLESRTNQALETAMAFVPDDEVGATTLNAQGFRTVLPLSELTGRLLGSPLLVSVRTSEGAQHFAHARFALSLPSSCSAGRVSFERSATNVLVDGGASVRFLGRTSLPSAVASAQVGEGDELPLWKGRRSRDRFWIDLPLDVAATAAMTHTPVRFSVRSEGNMVSQVCTPTLTISDLAMTQEDPYDFWPTPMCSDALRSCLSRRSNQSDTSSCGDPYTIRACGERPLPERCGLTQAKRLANTMVGTWWMSETDAPFTPVSFTVVGDESPGDTLRRALNLSEEVLVESRNLDMVLGGPSQDDPEGLGGERLRAAHYRTLFRQLSVWLDDVQVVRVGEIQIDVYFVGRDACGNLVGLKTLAVET